MKLKKKLVLKALTDPEFRKKLQENPEEVLSPEELKEITGGEIAAQADYIDGISNLIPIIIFCMVFPKLPWLA